jgi:hypothetical protein
MMSRILSVLRSARNSAQLVLEHFGGDLLKDIASNKIDLAQAGRTMELAVLAATRGRHAMNMLEESPWWIQYQLAGLGVTADDILWQRHASNTWLSGSQTYKQWASNLAAGYPIVGYSSPQHARAGSGAAFFRAQHCLAESDGGSLCDAPFIGAAMVGAVTDPLSPKARGGICNLAYRMVASNGEVNSLYEMSLSFTRDPLEPTGYLGRIGEDLVASIIFLNGFLALAGLPQIVLPQLINVLKGDMSLIGPRPERPFFVEQFQKEIPGYDLRHMMKAGITGWAQINGRAELTASVEEKLKYDLYYIQNWSFLFDIKILLRTIFDVLSIRNTY